MYFDIPFQLTQMLGWGYPSRFVYLQIKAQSVDSGVSCLCQKVGKQELPFFKVKECKDKYLMFYSPQHMLLTYNWITL